MAGFIRNINVPAGTTVLGNAGGRLKLPKSGFLTGVSVTPANTPMAPIFVSVFFELPNSVWGATLAFGWVRSWLSGADDSVYWHGRIPLLSSYETPYPNLLVSFRNDTGAAVDMTVSCVVEET